MADHDARAENEKLIADSTARLRMLSFRLGRAAEPLSILPDSRLLEYCRNAVSIRKKAEATLAESGAFRSDYEERSAERAKAEKEEKGIRDAIKSLSVRLGAVLQEQCSFSLLDKDLFGEVYRLTEKDSVRKGMFSKFLSRNRDEDRFLSYASAVLSSSLDGHLQGRAADLVREIRELEEKDALMIGKITALSGYLDDNKDSFQRTVKQGITDCRKNLEKLTAEEEEKFVSYGYFLYENGSTWVSESTPSEILDILQSILEEHDRYNALIDRREMLQRKERVDGVRALISEEEEKIRILEAEKARIDDEIAGIREEIAKLRIRLDGLSG